MGQTYEALNEKENALKIYNQLEHKDATLCFVMGGLSEDLEEYDRAIGLYRACLKDENEMDNISMVYASLANCFGHLNDLDGAIQTFQEAVQRYPTEEKYLYNLGILHQAANDTKQAKRCFEMCLTLDPTSQSAQTALAQI